MQFFHTAMRSKTLDRGITCKYGLKRVGMIDGSVTEAHISFLQVKKKTIHRENPTNVPYVSCATYAGT